MSVQRLRKIAENIVKEDPDLVLLTGDFYTFESHNEKYALSQGLEPLKKLKKRTFACLGNHDHEVLQTVKDELARLDITLLVNEQVTVDTRLGKVQILGFDYVSPLKAKDIIPQLASRLMKLKEPNTLPFRLILHHNPHDFTYIPEDEHASIVLSGHYHGGHVGVKKVTFIRLIGQPDQGFFCKDKQSGAVVRLEEGAKQRCGKNVLYAHRGNGFYGLPLRIGVHGEESVLHVHF
jgi:predicted MPP superfamily phosphohydrolase